MRIPPTMLKGCDFVLSIYYHPSTPLKVKQLKYITLRPPKILVFNDIAPKPNFCCNTLKKKKFLFFFSFLKTHSDPSACKNSYNRLQNTPTLIGMLLINPYVCFFFFDRKNYVALLQKLRVNDYINIFVHKTN